MLKVLLILLLFSCQLTVFGQVDSLIINGYLEGFEKGDNLYFWETRGNVRLRVDTIKIQDHKFRFSYYLEETPNLIRITNDKNRSRISIWVENEEITISGKASEFDKVKVLASKFIESEAAFISTYNRDSSINNQLEVIEKHLNTPSSIYNLNRIYRKVPVVKLAELYEKFDEKWKNHDFGKTIGHYLKLAPKSVPSIGDYIIDFNAKDQTGQEFQLLNQLKNSKKYILLEFKNLYCPYSKKAIGELEIIEEKYKNELEIISFLDDTREYLWERYLSEDVTKWKKLWDGEGETGITCVAYGVKGSPYYFLISKDGIIQNKWTGYEKGLIEENIEKVLADD